MTPPLALLLMMSIKVLETGVSISQLESTLLTLACDNFTVKDTVEKDGRKYGTQEEDDYCQE